MPSGVRVRIPPAATALWLEQADATQFDVDEQTRYKSVMRREVYRSPLQLIGGYRAYVVHYDDGHKTTLLEHRLVMERKLGRRLSRDEVVHHKDGDKRNNRLSNLELTTRSAHAKAHAEERPSAETVSLQCAECGRRFKRLARHERHNRRQGKHGPFCGRSCGAKYSRRIRAR